MSRLTPVSCLVGLALLVALMTGALWLAYAVEGHDTIARASRGESIAYLNAMFRGESQPLAALYAYFDGMVFRALLLGAVLVVALLIAALGARRGLHHTAAAAIDSGIRALAARPGLYLTVLGLVSFALSAGTCVLVLDRFPNSGDEYAYLFHGETLAKGRLWNPLPAYPEFFQYAHVIQHDGKWVSRFPPGWPLVLAAGGLLHVPAWIVNPLVGVAALWAYFKFAALVESREVAVASTIVVTASAFFLFNAASFFSHVSTFVGVLGLAYYGRRWLSDDRISFALAAGACAGFAFLARPYTALVCAMPFTIAVLSTQPWRRYVGLLWIAAGAAPVLFLLLVYQDQITGNPLVPVTRWTDATEGLGFVKGHTLSNGLLTMAKNLVGFVYWTPPFLLPVVAACLLAGTIGRSARLRHEDWIFPALVIAYLLYWSTGGNQYGPRFYFEGFPFAVLTTTSWLFGRHRLAHTPSRDLLVTLSALGLVLHLGAMGLIARTEHRVISERRDLYAVVEAAHLRQALVFLTSGTGVRRSMPVRDLTRNGTDADGEVLYVRDLGDENAKLLAAHPTRTAYRYVRERGSVRGRLEPLPRPAATTP